MLHLLSHRQLKYRFTFTHYLPASQWKIYLYKLSLLFGCKTEKHRGGRESANMLFIQSLSPITKTRQHISLVNLVRGWPSKMHLLSMKSNVNETKQKTRRKRGKWSVVSGDYDIRSHLTKVTPGEINLLSNLKSPHACKYKDYSHNMLMK